MTNSCRRHVLSGKGNVRCTAVGQSERDFSSSMSASDFRDCCMLLGHAYLKFAYRDLGAYMH